jgi:hypothetical protein
VPVHVFQRGGVRGAGVAVLAGGARQVVPVGLVQAETLTNSNSRRSSGSRSTTRSASATWASKEVGDVTPSSGVQWLSWKSPGNTQPSGARLLKNPTPPMHAV